MDDSVPDAGAGHSSQSIEDLVAPQKEDLILRPTCFVSTEMLQAGVELSCFGLKVAPSGEANFL